MTSDLFQFNISRHGEFWRSANTFNTPVGIKIFREVISGETYPLRPFFGPIRTIVDIGANVGASVLHFAAEYPDARIVAFEPAPETFELLKANVVDLPNISIFNIGLSDADGEATMYRGCVDPVTNSIYQSPECGKETVRVPIRQAAQVLVEQRVDSIDLLKVDTEGCEVPIFRSLAHFIPEVRVIFLEYHSEADRLELDQLLSPTHMLCSARADIPHRGEICYLSKATILELATARIVRNE